MINFREVKGQFDAVFDKMLPFEGGEDEALKDQKNEKESSESDDSESDDEYTEAPKHDVEGHEAPYETIIHRNFIGRFNQVLYCEQLHEWEDTFYKIGIKVKANEKTLRRALIDYFEPKSTSVDKCRTPRCPSTEATLDEELDNSP